MLNRAIERVPKISLMVHLFITGTILDCNIQIEYIWLYLNVMGVLCIAIECLYNWPIDNTKKEELNMFISAFWALILFYTITISMNDSGCPYNCIMKSWNWTYNNKQAKLALVMILLVKAIFTVVENRFLHKNDENEYNTEVNGKMEVVTQE